MSKNLKQFTTTFIVAFLLLVGSSVVRSESDIPREADISVAGIFLSDPDSTRNVLGTLPSSFDASDLMPIVQVCNSKSNEVLTLYFHHGDILGSFTEFRIETMSIKPTDCIMIETSGHFVTGKGIHLGMSKKELIEILGPNFTESRKGSEKIVIYRINSLEKSKFLQKYNLPVYYGTYHFQKDNLIEFEFGFEYP